MPLNEKLSKYRISKEEYGRICDLLGREPEGVEWALFSALWSEHCSYKSSKVHLKNLFNKSPRVVESFGENAGVVDLGEGERVAFKMESHNHPSYIEPYQGAATGVGGILRDIFTMGARPIALANYLCFGELEAPRMKELVTGVVGGIGGYGNCVGVPMVTGKTQFHRAYNGNILVNAFALGYLGPEDKLVTSKARGIGNYVVYAGAQTGRDGVHGASMASESFSEESEAKRPTVQIGDPFYEKLLIEATLEVISQDLVAAVQDMGAAGLTSSSFEMASKGGVGLDLDLSRVPVRDRTMEAEDLLLSESQERMLFVVEPGKWEKFKTVFDKWDLEAAVIGKVITERKINITFGGELLTSIDPDLIVEHAPVYERPAKKSEAHQIPRWAEPSELKGAVESLKAPSHRLAPWIYSQFDQRVGASTVRDCSYAVGGLRLKHSGRGLGVALGGRISVLGEGAFLGGWDSIFFPALQLSGLGFEPLAVTDCLNFGNPENPVIMGQFVQSLEGMNLACETLGAPIISGNVSFYNETTGENVLPTPATGLVGLQPELNWPQESFVEAGHQIYLIDFTPEWTGGKSITEEEVGALSKRLEKDFSELRIRARKGDVQVFRAVGEGGALKAILQMSRRFGIGAKLKEQLSGGGFYQAVVVSKTAPESWAWSEGVKVRSIGTTQPDTVEFLSERVSVQELAALAAKGL